MKMNDNSSNWNFLQKILLGCLLFSLAISTVFGNLLVLYAIRTEKRLRTVSNLFILSLAFADLVVGLIVMPLSAADIINGRWPFSNIICQLWLSIDYVASTASIYNLILLSLDRYWAVVYPLVYLRNRSRKRAIYFILIVWLISLLWVPAIIFWPLISSEQNDSLKPSECDTSFRSNKLFKTLTALVNFYIPLLAMIIISCRIMVAIRSRSTMEFGRRISSTARRQMTEYRTFNYVSVIRSGLDEGTYTKPLSSDETNGQPTTVSILTNPFESVVETANPPSDDNTESTFPNNDENDNLSQCRYHRKRSFHLSDIKPIKILFPSVKQSNKRRSEVLPRTDSNRKMMTNSFSVSHDMKYPDRLFKSKEILRTLSSESSSDECSRKVYDQTLEQQISRATDKNPTDVIMPSSSQLKNSPLTTTAIPVTPVTTPKEMNIFTFFDYIIDPSRSSSLQKELKAARQLGMLVGVFTITWLPYFILFLVVAWCQHCVSDRIYTGSIWLAYLNSTVNPVIYPLCNKHFRHAFRKIFYCHHAKTKLPNLNGLRELHAIHSVRHRR